MLVGLNAYKKGQVQKSRNLNCFLSIIHSEIVPQVPDPQPDSGLSRWEGRAGGRFLQEAISLVRGPGVNEQLSQCTAGGTLGTSSLQPAGQPDVSLEIHPGERMLDYLFVNRCCLNETSLHGGLPLPRKMSMLGIYNPH